MDLKDYFDYTWRARARLLDAFEPLTPEEWRREFDFSFRSIKRLVAHIIEVERGWMLGDIEQVRFEPPGPEARDRLYGTVHLARATGREVEGISRRVLDAYVPARLGETRICDDLEGKPTQFTVEQILTHVFTHELRHQGQLQAMLRLLGKPAPNVDWI
jgi:uncharacterized damage-inducible protein DinB